MASTGVKVSLVPLIIGIVILVLGCVLGYVVFPTVLESEIESNVVLKEDTLQWYRFKEIPFPVIFKAYFFSIENPHEILNGSKPIVRERGPYVYKERRAKDILSLKSDLVKYNEVWTYEFDPELSGDNTEDDELLIMHSPLMAILQSLEDIPFVLPYPIDEILSDIFEEPRMFIKVKAKDYGFNGIKMCDPRRSTTGWSKLICLAVMLLNQKFIEYNDDRTMQFSAFTYKTRPDGPFTAHRGIYDLDKLGLITEYKNKKYTEFWNGKKSECDKVEGHYTTYPPFMEKDSEMKVYSTDICKTGIVKFVGESSFKDVKGYRFATNKESFSTPEQKCVCINQTRGLDGEKHCYSDGVLDMNTCFGGIPIVLSFPHLMWAGEEYQNSTLGLKMEERDDHNMIIDFEPTIGFPLRGSIRIQFNMILRPVKYGDEFISLTEDLPRSFLPLLWVEENFELTDSLIDELNSKLLNNLVMMEGVKWGFIAVGILMMVLSIGFCIFYSSRSK